MADPITKIQIDGAGRADVNGEYLVTGAEEIPRGFDKVCRENGWNTLQMWKKLGGGKPWFKAPNEAYIYWNHGDGHWWIDAPDGMGVYKAATPEHTSSLPQKGWKLLGSYSPAPALIQTIRAGQQSEL